MTAAHDPAKPDRDEEAATWCLDLAGSGLSPERRLAFERWRSDAANEAAFQRAAATWDIVEALGSAPEILRMRSEALESYRQVNARRWQRPVGRRRWLWGATGAVAATLALAAGWTTWPTRETWQTRIGERRLAVLEDGSRLSLDAASEVDTRFDRHRRDLTLVKGRAKFDVAHNPLRPFAVSVGNKRVVAVGTSFVVERLGDMVSVVLFDGHVALLDDDGTAIGRGDGRAIDAELVPGRAVSFSATRHDPATLRAAGEDGSLGWQQGQLSFDDVPLPLAVERMNRYLGEPLVVADRNAARVRVTGVFDGRNATAFLDALRQLSGVRSDRRSGKVFLSRE